ncbi:alpha/beta hydrolase [Rhodococcus aetherivorans]|uniref:alpha/beta hydrolase n=1 Tax=Rhodococcus aetherivorans TaxID=191292 RepID=UPI003CD04247
MAVALTMTVGNGVAGADVERSADPVVASGALLVSPAAADGSEIVSHDIDGQHLTLEVYSAAMDKDITVHVQRPRDASEPRPVLYLVNGAGGGVGKATWWANTNVGEFLAAQDVNVVMPVGGPFAYYADWKHDDPVLGRNKWQTFFLEELPPLVDEALGTSGVQAIAANSMTATAVLQYAIAKPGFYSAVAAYSGCAQTSDPIGTEFMKLVVETYGGGDIGNMYGDDDDPLWRANDPVVNAEGLRGTPLFLSDATGLPGPHETLGSEFTIVEPEATTEEQVLALANQVVVGGVIEAAVHWCTTNLQTRLNELGIPATYDLQPGGTHSWGYWQDAFYRSWPLLAEGLELPQ